ncbi:hypothetical protein B0A52_09326 [Exophiala mesophila]|uniref:Protein kinase domain-containing protein n=1 Tax=Exophiala mesophila TaxID=212818 RepID=A0A438MWH8_EXOME|nr:hypothetical protein B0A52_09326 [Exophiala mesophila]
MGKAHHNVTSPLTKIESEPGRHRHLFGMRQKFHRLFSKDDPMQSPIDCSDDDGWPSSWTPSDPSRPDPPRVGLPRQATFRRQNSERRERLLPVEPGHAERRAFSSTRQISTSLPRPRATSSPPYWQPGRASAPIVANSIRASPEDQDFVLPTIVALPSDPSLQVPPPDHAWPPTDLLDRPPRPPSTTSSDASQYAAMAHDDDKADLRAELDSRWILNLSMHFRDKSDREKFFVTYAETPNRWRRVTVSCDYRNAEPGSLEVDLKELQFQRDKSLQIYESIRDSLPEIQFYDTVTNLKLETTEGRLHVHVTEDVHEIIPYPSRSIIAHTFADPKTRPLEVRESDLIFDSHLSGFVYKVKYKGQVYIKKEIPGPDTVDEFLYEINALHDLHDSNHVIHLEAIILDDERQVVKGLLITYAERGAIVDLLYDHKGNISWDDRCRWAEDAVRGLSEIHEEGYVQGDFTLSNIVVDDNNRAKIIDINRRGCPVGWEPPEIATKIASNQRISMYIGEKSDLYQLGMTLWALAMDDDEPERHAPFMSVQAFPQDVPEWYQDIVRICLSTRPRDRLSAKDLVDLFPEARSTSSEDTRPRSNRPRLKLLNPHDYIDPADAVGRDDIERLAHQRVQNLTPYSPESSRDDYSFTYPKSSNYEIESQSSAYERPRGRRPPTNFGHLERNERRHWISYEGDTPRVEETEPNIVSVSPGGERDLYDEIDFNGHPYLISRGTFNEEEIRILEMASTTDLCSSEQVTPQGSGAPSIERLERTATPVKDTSVGSDRTPRGSRLTLPIFSPSEKVNSTSSIISDETARSFEMVSTQGSPEQTQPVTVTPAPASHGPPSLPYDDSGYDEPFIVSDPAHEEPSVREDSLCSVHSEDSNVLLHGTDLYLSSAIETQTARSSKSIEDLSMLSAERSASLEEVPGDASGNMLLGQMSQPVSRHFVESDNVEGQASCSIIEAQLSTSAPVADDGLTQQKDLTKSPPATETCLADSTVRGAPVDLPHSRDEEVKSTQAESGAGFLDSSPKEKAFGLPDEPHLQVPQD